MRRPWFPFYCDDFEMSGRVRLMTNAERGCYLTLLAYQWREGSVPSEVVDLAQLCNETPATMRKYWRRLESCFPVGQDGKRRNPRQHRERVKADELSAQQSANAKRRPSRGSPVAGTAVESRQAIGSDSAGSAVTTTHVTRHTSQPTEQKPRLLPDEDEKREPVSLHEAIAASPILRRATP